MSRRLTERVPKRMLAFFNEDTVNAPWSEQFKTNTDWGIKDKRRIVGWGRLTTVQIVHEAHIVRLHGKFSYIHFN